MTTPNPPQTTSWSARLMALAAFGGSILTLAYPSATRQFTWAWVVLLSLVWLIPLMTCLGTLGGGTSLKRPNELLGSGLLLLSLATFLSAAISPYATLSLLRIWPTLAGVALFFWLHHWLAAPGQRAGEVRAEFLARAMAGFGAVIAIVSVVGWRWHSAGQPGIVRNDFPFGHSTYAAGALVLLLPWLFQATFNSRGMQRLGWMIMGVAGFVALLATSSRGGVIAISAVGATGIGLIVFRARWQNRSKISGAVIMVGILLIAILANPRLRELMQGGGWGDSARESNAQRSAMIDAGWRMGLSRPWTGWGPGSVPLVYPKVRGRLIGGVDNVLQLHDTPIQVWATLGAGGMLALILLVAATLRRLLQMGKQPAISPIALTAASSVTGYALFSLTDHQLDLPAMNALFVLSLALLFQNDPGTNLISFSRGQRLAGLLIAGVLLTAPLLLTVRDCFARDAYDRSLSLFEEDKPEAGLIELGIAVRRAPDDVYYRHQLASRLLEQRNHTADPAKQRRLAEEAATELEQSLAAGYFQEFAQLNLGWLALDGARPLVAAHHLLAAAREAPHRGGVYFGLGIALRNAGYESLAVRAFALEWLNDPVTYTAPVWEWPDFASLRPQVELEANALVTALGSSHPDALYVRDIWNWWTHGTPRPTHSFNRESALFVETIASLEKNQPPPSAIGNYNWGDLTGAWKPVDGGHDFLTVAQHDQAFSTALGHRQQRHPFPDWHGFFTAGLENEAGFLVSSLSVRTGYGVLALHPDGPVMTDLYVRQQNRFVSTFASTLFPAKGWIPASELLNRLPVLPPPKP